MQSWINGKKKEKQKITTNIFVEIQSKQPPGQFLVEVEEDVLNTTTITTEVQDSSGVFDSNAFPSLATKSWILVDREQAVEKI